MLRAKDDHDKTIRRTSILASAYQLFIDQQHTLPSVIDIAKKSGIAKGTIYLYFSTREEIYLEILETQIQEWFNSIEAAVDTPSPDIDSMVNTICNYLAEHPHFLPLLSILNTILERNLNHDVAYQFKKRTVEKLKTISEKVSDKFSVIDETSAAKLLLQGYGLIIGLWQVTDFPTKIRKMLNNDELLILNVDFTAEVKTALTALWQGTLLSK